MEEHIKDKCNCTKIEGLSQCMKKMEVDSDKFKKLKSKISQKDSNDEFFSKLKEIIKDEENSIDKYLIIYFHARNYLAHNNIDMTQFFWGSDGKRTIIINVLDAVMIILYRLETMDTESS